MHFWKTCSASVSHYYSAAWLFLDYLKVDPYCCVPKRGYFNIVLKYWQWKLVTLIRHKALSSWVFRFWEVDCWSKFLPLWSSQDLFYWKCQWCLPWCLPKYTGHMNPAQHATWKSKGYSVFSGNNYSMSQGDKFKQNKTSFRGDKSCLTESEALEFTRQLIFRPLC